MHRTFDQNFFRIKSIDLITMKESHIQSNIYTWSKIYKAINSYKTLIYENKF